MKHTYLILITFLLSGCVTGNYQSFSSGVGYQVEQQSDSEYYVTYTGTPKTKIEKVNDFALLRSAELTLEKGFNYFVITEAINNKTALTSVQQSLVSYRDFGMGDNSPVASSGALSGPSAKSELTISLYKDKPNGIAYDAQIIEKAIKEEYKVSDQPT